MSQPFAPLTAWFRAITAQALASGVAPEAVLEALAGAAGMASVAGGTSLDAISRDERQALVKAGRRAILSAGPRKPKGVEQAQSQEEEAEDLRFAADLAKAGLAALGGEAAEDLEGPADPMHPPDGRLSAATLGDLDGFALASLGLHVVRCGECKGRLAVLYMASAPAAAPLRVAAASAVAMRKPDAGRVVATLDEPAAELVLFDEEGARTLAVYADASAPVRLVGEGLETIEMLAGYWLGSVGREVSRLRGTLYVGDASAEIDIAIS